jgi:ABC-type antimicrobial peptide transport system permease subunit
MAGAAASGAALARDVMRRIDDRHPLVAVRTMDDQAAESLRQERLFTRLAVLLGGVTLVLSAIGLYGLLAYAVTARVPEIGLRMALGAERGEVRWMILRQSLALGAAGVLAGAAGAVAGTRLIDAVSAGAAGSGDGRCRRCGSLVRVRAGGLHSGAARLARRPARRAARRLTTLHSEHAVRNVGLLQPLPLFR